MMYKCHVKIILYVNTLGRIVATFHNNYIKVIDSPRNLEAKFYIRIHKKTLSFKQTISFQKRDRF